MTDPNRINPPIPENEPAGPESPPPLEDVPPGGGGNEVGEERVPEDLDSASAALP